MKPSDLTTDKSIIQLFQKMENPKRKSKKSIDDGKKRKKSSSAKLIENSPIKPPKAYGHILKIGKYIPNPNQRYIEVDPTIGSLRRFKSLSKYPFSPCETIPLRDIKYCKMISNANTNSTKKCFSFEIFYK